MARVPDAEAVVDLGCGERLTYAALWRRASAVAGGLVEAGITPGARVGVALPNGAAWTVAFLGILLAAAVPVPINPRLTTGERRHIVEDCGADLVIDGELPHGGPIERDASDPESLAALFYTSGTTGRPKGAMLSHRALLSAAEQVRQAYRLGADDGLRSLVAGPLFHVLASGMQWIPALVSGGCVVIMPSFEVGTWVRAIGDEQIEALNGVPAMFWQALRHPDFRDVDVSGVRILSYGAAPTPPAQALALREAFPGARLAPGYGLTEAPCVTGLQDHDALMHAGSVGTAVADTELGLIGPEADQGIGQLIVRGPQVMSGYWGNSSATTEALVDGWLHTGDIVRIDDGGRVFMLDRRTDLINRGGENVYSVEVEAALAAYPAVAESAVVAVSDERLGSRVAVCVVARPGVDFDPEQLVRVAREGLASFKVPELICLRTEPLPRNAAGKVDKDAVREVSEWSPLPR
ncbi:class I adenylate-forming enzyme family protein [Knoellia aerolata]|uniref:Acyl-CoA dehydrogenase n=1 Tax=Knoellia aerolata DSM 18566 TaxID=1385519 RepID=A0A0A0JZ12_9MICO|nr:AMP-binding protein [Knoellia aerolata]KGN41954.1 acyl-CoA dehydrogenase [Knoellia aerolata DSM 18566]